MHQPTSLKFGTFILLTFLSAVSSSYAQSGRTIPTASPTPENPEPVLQQSVTVQCESGQNEIEEIRFVRLEEFIDQINRLGNCSYKLNQVVRIVLDSDKSLMR